MDSANINPKMKQLVDNLVKQGVITTKKVIEVMKKVDRGEFCSYKPYVDSP